jgi:phage protein D
LLSFSPELNTTGVVNEVTVQGWDPMSKETIVGSAHWQEVWGNRPQRVSGGQMVEAIYRQGNRKPDECVRTEPVYTTTEAKDRALAVLKDKADTFITGSGESIGIPEIRVRTALELRGLGPFSMAYYVTGVTHTISGPGGYRTTFTVKSNTYAKGDSYVRAR